MKNEMKILKEIRELDKLMGSNIVSFSDVEKIQCSIDALKWVLDIGKIKV